MSFVQTTIIALICLCVIGCAGLHHPQPQTATIEGLAESFRPGQIVDLASGKGRLVAFTGNGHIVNKFGIPDRTVRRVPASMVTVMPYPLNGNETIDRAAADYVWFTLPSPQRFSMAQGGFWQ